MTCYIYIYIILNIIIIHIYIYLYIYYNYIYIYIYIYYFENYIFSKVLKFADDTKVFRQVKMIQINTVYRLIKNGKCY